MYCMVVTLDVSKLSGWLNADAYCRESKGGHTVQGEVRGELRGGTREAAGDRGASSVQGRDRLQKFGEGHGEERTENMPCMVVTLGVSRLSS